MKNSKICLCFHIFRFAFSESTYSFRSVSNLHFRRINDFARHRTPEKGKKTRERYLERKKAECESKHIKNIYKKIFFWKDLIFSLTDPVLHVFILALYKPRCSLSTNPQIIIITMKKKGFSPHTRSLSLYLYTCVTRANAPSTYYCNSFLSLFSSRRHY